MQTENGARAYHIWVDRELVGAYWGATPEQAIDHALRHCPDVSAADLYAQPAVELNTDEALRSWLAERLPEGLRGPADLDLLVNHLQHLGVVWDERGIQWTHWLGWTVPADLNVPAVFADAWDYRDTLPPGISQGDAHAALSLPAGEAANALTRIMTSCELWSSPASLALASEARAYLLDFAMHHNA